MSQVPKFFNSDFSATETESDPSSHDSSPRHASTLPDSRQYIWPIPVFEDNMDLFAYSRSPGDKHQAGSSVRSSILTSAFSDGAYPKTPSDSDSSQDTGQYWVDQNSYSSIISEETEVEMWHIQERSSSLRQTKLVSQKSFIHMPTFKESGVVISVIPGSCGHFQDADLISLPWYLQIIHEIRRGPKALVKHPLFDQLVLVLILVSCVMQALDDPTTDDETEATTVTNDVLSVLFTLEMTLKMLAMGIKGYFSISWNWLDFVVVCEGIISLSGAKTIKFTILRALRALRPLRSLKFLPGVRVIIGAMMKSMKSLGYVVLVYALFLLMASLFATLLWKGSFQNQCLIDGDGIEDMMICGTAESSFVSSYEDEDTDNVMCNFDAVSGYQCLSGEMCTYTGENPNGFMSFDNLGVAMLTLFQVTTLDSWNTVMTYTQHAMGQYTLLFFIFLILLGSYTLVNLVIATILDDIGEAVEKEDAEEARKLMATSVVSPWVNTNHERTSLGFEKTDKEAERDDISQTASSAGSIKEGSEKDVPRSKPHSTDNMARIAPTGSDAVDFEQSQKRRSLESSRASLAKTTNILTKIPLNFQCTVRSPRMKALCNNEGSRFNQAVYGLILLNTLALSFDGHGLSFEHRYYLRLFNIFFNVAFLIELLFRLMVLGITFFTSAFNVFDFVTVIGAFIDMIVRGYDSGTISIIRLLRVLKLFRFFRFSQGHGKVAIAMKMVSASAQNMLPAVILLMLCMFIFSILGMELFGTFEHDERNRFDSFAWSFINIFILIVGDGWSDMMYTVIENNNASRLYCLFFLALVVLGQYVILNLVLAIVLDSDDTASNAINLKRKILKILRMQMVRAYFLRWVKGTEFLDDQEESFRRLKEYESTHDVTAFEEKAHEVQLEFIPGRNLFNSVLPRSRSRFDLIFGSMFQETTAWKPAKLGVNMKLILETKLYFWIMSGFILASTILLFCEPTGSITKVSLICTEAVLCFIFALELLMKGLAYSFWVAQDALLRSKWNLLDVFLVFASLAHIIAFFGGADENVLRKIQVFLSFRPLRLGIRSEKFREMILSLHESVKGVTSVVILLVIVWGIYAIIGVQLFKGVLHSCTDPSFPEGAYRYGTVAPNGTWLSPPCSGTWINPATGVEEYRDYEWTPGYFNFDNFLAAMWSLWLLMVLEDWTVLLWRTVDGYKEDHQPITNYNRWAFLYFFFGVILFGFYLINLSVGVIADTYITIRTRNNEGIEMVDEDYMQLETLKAIQKVKPRKVAIAPTHSVGKICFKIVHHRYYEMTIMFILVLVAVSMGTYHDGQSESIAVFQEISEQIFTILFVIEATIAIIGLTPKYYFSKGSHIFDFFITVICVVDTITFSYALDCSASAGSTLITFLRGLRVLRLIRLLWRIKGTKKVLAVALYPIQLLGVIVYIIGMSIIFFGSIGVAIFEKFTPDDYSLDFQNFSDLKSAIQLLYICSTGEMWIDYKDAYMDAGSNEYATSLYFFVFLITQQFLLVNLFVVIVCHTYDVLKVRGFMDNDIHLFKCLYSKLDGQADKGLQKHQVFEVLSRLQPPLGLGPGSPFVAVQLRADLLMGHNKSIGFQKLLQGCYRASYLDASIDVALRDYGITLQRAYCVSRIYKFLSNSKRIRNHIKVKNSQFIDKSFADFAEQLYQRNRSRTIRLDPFENKEMFEKDAQRELMEGSCSETKFSVEFDS